MPHRAPRSVARAAVSAFLAILAAGGAFAGCDDAPSDAGTDADVEADADAGADADEEANAEADAEGCDPSACDEGCLDEGSAGGRCEGGSCRCVGDPGGPWTPAHGEAPLELEWDPACLNGQPSELLDQLLAASGTTAEELRFTDEDRALSSYAAQLDDPALLSWYLDLWRRPLTVPCFTGALVEALDQGVAEGGPVSAAIALGAWLTDRPVSPLLRPPAPADVEQPLVEAVATLIELAGDEPNLSSLERSAANVPLEVQQVVAPVIRALGPVISARAAWVSSYDLLHPLMLYHQVLAMVVLGSGTALDITDAAALDLLLSPERQGLNQAAYDLARTIELADWGSIVEQEASFEVRTPIGRIIIGGPGDDTYTELDHDDEIALLVELGGDDVYQVPAGATASGDNLVSVNLDLRGSDSYGYLELGDPDDQPYLLPSDGGTRYQGDESYGPISLSNVARQGAGVLGVGLLFDLGIGADRYQSLRLSQGAGVLGVGVLYDQGGQESYLAEAASQGAAYYGIGAAIDEGVSNDERRLFHEGQGFGSVSAAGLLWDGGGDDGYLADIGDPALGGHPLYASAQRPGTGNSSFTGGAGFGRRGDGDGLFLSGGLGLLRDRGDGDDDYTSSVFGLGTGYWQGTGLLVDDGGDDHYDALWYVMGGAAHYALGALFDRAGNDTFNELRGVVGVSQGSGHDYSVGLLWDGAGDDWHYASHLGMGTGNCTGIGLAVDEAGADTYLADTGNSYGTARTSTECDSTPSRQVVATRGFFLDGGGDDDYAEIPDGVDEAGLTVQRADDLLWLFNAPSDYDVVQQGGGVDGTGGCGLTLP